VMRRCAANRAGRSRMSPTQISDGRQYESSFPDAAASGLTNGSRRAKPTFMVVHNHGQSWNMTGRMSLDRRLLRQRRQPLSLVSASKDDTPCPCRSRTALG
jgi:hypothetical protein